MRCCKLKKVIYKCNIDNEPATLVQSLDDSIEIIYKDKILQKISSKTLHKINNAFSLDEIVHFVVNNEIYLDKQKKEFAAMIAKIK